MRRILILGAGRSAPYLIHRLLESASVHDWQVTVADRELELAESDGCRSSQRPRHRPRRLGRAADGGLDRHRRCGRQRPGSRLPGQGGTALRRGRSPHGLGFLSPQRDQESRLLGARARSPAPRRDGSRPGHRPHDGRRSGSGHGRGGWSGAGVPLLRQRCCRRPIRSPTHCSTW